MKTQSLKSVFVLCSVLFLAACQQKEFRTVYPEETPQLSGTIVQSEVLYGADSLDVTVSIKADKTPLSTLTVMLTCGEQEKTKKISEKVVRTKGYAYDGSFRFEVPFLSGMTDGAPIRVYLTAENVEGNKAQTVLTGCTGHSPSIPTLYIMPPTISYTAIGKGKQMTKEGDVFAAYDLGFPKSFEFLLATVGTKFGRIDWNQPVFGLVNGDISLITQEMFESGVATAITIEDDERESIDTVKFNSVSFELTYGGKIAAPVSKIDINADLEEAPKYISSSSVAKKYRGAKIFLAQDSEVEIEGAVNVADAYNLDYMEYISGNKVKFLGETGMYYVSYKMEEDYLVVEPLYELTAPEVMYVCGVGLGHPSHTPSATSGWGFDSPDQNFVGRTIAPKVYQFTLYMKNGENADYDDYGSLNFKFFHQHGWGGEEAGYNYQQVGLNIYGSPGITKKDGSTGNENGNWIATKDPIDGVYRMTLDMNNMTTTYEKIR
ncbi:MAG: DUF5121 domain-containing protein [Paludibacteraceae bacterium]|nr:DUF5121 domain-containing protein [Paludibacteraceae bacterium]